MNTYPPQDTTPPMAALIEKIDAFCAELGELGAVVQVCAVLRDGGTDTDYPYDHGSGSIYTRQALVHDWLITQDEYTREHARAQQRKEDEEE